MNHHAPRVAKAPFVNPEWLMEEPHAMLAAMQWAHPVIRLADNHYLALRAADILALMKDPRTVQIEGADFVLGRGIPDGAMARFARDILLFSNGPHRCIGEMLARVEMEESLAALIDGAPGIVLENAPRMLGFGGIRRITPMAVRIGRGR